VLYRKFFLFKWVLSGHIKNQRVLSFLIVLLALLHFGSGVMIEANVLILTVTYHQNSLYCVIIGEHKVVQYSLMSPEIVASLRAHRVHLIRV
jgi:hypothetical protein